MVAQRTATRLLLGREIKYMIDKVGVTQQEAADMIRTVRTRIGSLIDGTASITIGDLERLARMLGFTDPDYLASLEDLRNNGHKRGFWVSDHKRAYFEDFRLMVDLEKYADLMRAVQVEVMPGLLQCESYVRALHGSEYATSDVVPIQPDPDDHVTLDDVVLARLERQAILLGSDAPEYRVVMSESCLRREYGTPEVMREQCQYLIEMSKRRNVAVQVVPFRVRPRSASMTNPCVLMRVPSPGIAGPMELVYVEGESEIRYIDDNTAVKAHETAWARLTAAALDEDDSRKLIAFIATTYR